jgi:hypothetical protein
MAATSNLPKLRGFNRGRAVARRGNVNARAV